MPQVVSLGLCEGCSLAVSMSLGLMFDPHLQSRSYTSRGGRKQVVFEKPKERPVAEDHDANDTEDHIYWGVVLQPRPGSNSKARAI